MRPFVGCQPPIAVQIKAVIGEKSRLGPCDGEGNGINTLFNSPETKIGCGNTILQTEKSVAIARRRIQDRSVHHRQGGILTVCAACTLGSSVLNESADTEKKQQRLEPRTAESERNLAQWMNPKFPNLQQNTNKHRAVGGGNDTPRPPWNLSNGVHLIRGTMAV